MSHVITKANKKLNLMRTIFSHILYHTVLQQSIPNYILNTRLLF